MMLVTVFRHVPPPIIGTVGVTQDRAFEAFEERLDWLEAIGLLVERFDPSTAPAEWRRTNLCGTRFRPRATGACPSFS